MPVPAGVCKVPLMHPLASHPLMFIPTDSAIAVCYSDDQYIHIAIQFLRVFYSIRKYCIITSEALVNKIQSAADDNGICM